MALFHVVEFLEKAGLHRPVAVIPDSWLLAFKDNSGRRMCNWPPKSVKADASFIYKAKKPDPSWPLHPIRLHKSLSSYKEATRICEKLAVMLVEGDNRNTPSQPKRMRITPVRFWDAQLTDSEGEGDAEASQCDEHSVMQLYSPQLPYSLAPVVGTSSWVSTSSSSRKSAVSPSRLQIPLSAARPASKGTHDPFKAKQEKVALRQLSLLEEIKNDLKDLKRKFSRMEERIQKEQTTRVELPEGFQFPLHSSEDLERLELDLKSDPEKRTRLECYLAMRGGFTLKHVLRAILSTLFSTELARSYNMNGLKGKKGLKDHPLVLQTIRDASRKHYPEATDADMQVHISTWLAGARDRDYGRRERAEHSLHKPNCSRVGGV